MAWHAHFTIKYNTNTCGNNNYIQQHAHQPHVFVYTLVSRSSRNTLVTVKYTTACNSRVLVAKNSQNLWVSKTQIWKTQKISFFFNPLSKSYNTSHLMLFITSVLSCNNSFWTIKTRKVMSHFYMWRTALGKLVIWRCLHHNSLHPISKACP